MRMIAKYSSSIVDSPASPPIYHHSMYPKLYNSGGVSYWRLCDDQFLRTTTSFVRYMRCLSCQLVPGLYLCILLFSPPLRVDRKSNVFLFVVGRVFQWGKNVRPVYLPLSLTWITPLQCSLVASSTRMQIDHWLGCFRSLVQRCGWKRRE